MAEDSGYDGMIKEALVKFGLRKPIERDEVKLREAARRGQKAQQLLEDPDLSQAFTIVEDVYMSAWRLSDFLDVEKRERCHVAASLLKDLRTFLIACVENGDAARAEIAKIAFR
jgi:hypothetical protein